MQLASLLRSGVCEGFFCTGRVLYTISTSISNSKHWFTTPFPRLKLQALVYDTLPPTKPTVDYTIGLEILSANEQFFDNAQKAVRL